MSDERRYRVTVTQPYIYEVWAYDEEQARRIAMQRWADKVPAQVAAFPIDFEVEEIKEQVNDNVT